MSPLSAPRRALRPLPLPQTPDLSEHCRHLLLWSPGKELPGIPWWGAASHAEHRTSGEPHMTCLSPPLPTHTGLFLLLFSLLRPLCPNTHPYALERTRRSRWTQRCHCWSTGTQGGAPVLPALGYLLLASTCWGVDVTCTFFRSHRQASALCREHQGFVLPPPEFRPPPGAGPFLRFVQHPLRAGS